MEDLVRLSPVSLSALVIYGTVFLIAAYYLGTWRPAAGAPKTNTRFGVLVKVLLLVCLTCFAIASVFHAAANPANHRGAPVSLTYVLRTEPSNANASILRRLEGEFMKAAAEKGSQGYMSYYADDAVEVPNGGPLIQGKINIAKGMGFLDDKNNQLIWTPVGADISASSDLGYTYGNYEFHSKDKEGKPSIEYGKYTSIWKKQGDGSWKVVLDMGNASPAPKM
jgi:ketosteroid isomerase-like protein